MNLPVIFRPQARREFDDAADWYEQRRTGLGARFVAAVQQVLDEVSANPQRYPEVFGDVRERIVQGFPYCVYYREENGQIIVLAVVHAAQIRPSGNRESNHCCRSSEELSAALFHGLADT